MERNRTPYDRQAESRRKQALGLWGSVIKEPEGDSSDDDSLFGEDNQPAPEPSRVFSRPPDPPRPPGTIRLLLGYLYIGSLLTLATIVFLALGYGWPMLQDYVEGLQLEKVSNYRPDLGSQLFSADGSLIAEFYKETKRQRLARFEDLPKHLVDALVATEDQQFYKHNGVNPIRIAKAFYTNFTTGTHQGGSTITQQIAKNMIVGDERKYERKIKEALYALKIEQQLSKEEIITIYLNQMPYGHTWEGIWAASEGYYGKAPADLDLAEAATLVGLLKGNTIYSPLINPERSKDRRGVVLNEMFKCGYITQEERDKAAKEDPVPVQKSTDRRPSLNLFPYWRAYFEEVLFRSRATTGELPPTNDQIQEIGQDQIYKGGLKIQTTLDPTLQKWGEEELQKALANIEKERRKFMPGWGLEEEDRPTFPDRLYPNATLLGQITGVVKQEWLTVKINGVKGTPVVAVPYPDSNDWRVRFKVLLPGYYVQIKCLERPTVGDGSPVYPEQDLVDRGLATKQKFVFQLINADRDQHAQGALVTLEVGTGRVLSWVGGYDWNEETVGRQRIRCIEGEQPGSSFKPIVFADAFGRGYTPATYVSNEPFSKFLPNGTVWTPKNYNKEKLGGSFQIRDVLTQSLNIPTVRVFDTIVSQAYDYDPITQQPTLAMARKLGIRSPIPKELSAALGTADITPLEMATAYSVFANDGVLVEPYTIERIDTRDSGQRVYTHLPAGNPQALDPITAFLMTDILKDVLRKQRGTGFQYGGRDFPYPIAGKTGTTNLYNDAWFVGYSKNLVTALWIGHDRRTSLGNKMAGGKLTVPPWLSYMKKAIPYHLKQYEGWSDADIASASGDALNPKHKLAFSTPGKGVKRIQVCSVSYKIPNEYCDKLHWIWVKEGEETREVCTDCPIFMTTDPVTGEKVQIPREKALAMLAAQKAAEKAGSETENQESEASLHSPVESRRLQPLPPVPASESSREPGVEIQSGERGWVPQDEDYPEEPPAAYEPAVPRKITPPVERRRL